MIDWQVRMKLPTLIAESLHELDTKDVKLGTDERRYRYREHTNLEDFLDPCSTLLFWIVVMVVLWCLSFTVAILYFAVSLQYECYRL